MTVVTSVSPGLRSPGWGEWSLNPDTQVLSLPGDKMQVDLSTVTSYQGLIKRVLRLANKDWATDMNIAGLLRALVDIINPELTYETDSSHYVSKGHLRQRVVDYICWEHNK